MRVKKISLLWLLTLLLLAACNPFSKNKPEDTHFRIFETTDIHGSIFPFDFVDSTEVSVSLAQIYSLVRSEREQDDQEVMKSFPGSSERNSGSIIDYVSAPLGRLESSISAKYAFFDNSAFVDLVHNIQIDLTKADISFTAPLSFNATLPSGMIRVRDMFKLYGFENFLYTMVLNLNFLKNIKWQLTPTVGMAGVDI